MFLSKSPHGIYYLYYNDTNNKRQKISTHSRLKTDALQFLQTFKADDSRKRKERSIVSLETFKKDFLIYAVGNYSKATVEGYRSALEKLIATIGDMPLSSITPQHFDRFKVKRLTTPLKHNLEKTISPNTVNIELRTLKASLNTALRWGIIKCNPFSNQKMALVGEASPVYFHKADIQTLLNKINEVWLKELIVFAALTGMRRGEIINLHWSDIDFERQTITVQSSPTFKTKNGKKRVVPINNTLMYLLRSKAEGVSSKYVFTLNGNQIPGDLITHKFKAYVLDCCLRESRLHFHSLRHTFASWLVQDGVSIYAVKELLGHSDIKTTLVYSHLQPEHLLGTVNRISIALN